MYDVIIVGAGPSGLYSARLLEKNFRVLVLEEDGEIGKPVQCSGLISNKLDSLVRIDKSFVEHEVSGALFHYGKNGKLKMQKPGIMAYVIDRGKFDSYLSKSVKSEIMLNSKVSKIRVGKDSVSVNVKGKELESRMLLGCDGPNSVVRNHFKTSPSEVMKGLIAITKNRDVSRFVEIWFDKDAAPDGFLWKIPRGATTEYGMLSGNASFRELEKFFRLKQYEKRAGLIPIGLQKTYFPRTLLIGDAAGQVKPWSGGGVIYGLTCAGIACDVIGRAFEEKKFSEDFLREYEDRWRKEIEKQIKFGLMFRELYKDMGREDVENMFDKLSKKGSFDMDMDFPISFLE